MGPVHRLFNVPLLFKCLCGTKNNGKTLNPYGLYYWQHYSAASVKLLENIGWYVKQNQSTLYAREFLKEPNINMQGTAKGVKLKL